MDGLEGLVTQYLKGKALQLSIVFGNGEATDYLCWSRQSD